MITNAQFNEFWHEFSIKFPAAREYVEKQPIPSGFLDGIYQSVACFDLDTLKDLIRRMLIGEIEPIPNTDLGHIGNQIRSRCRRILDERRAKEPQDWQKWSAVEVIQSDSKLSWMMACAQAADRLLGDRATGKASDFNTPNSVRAARGSYCAAIIMADTHTATEERDCLQAFSHDGLSWAQIQAEAKRQPVTIETKEVDDEEEVTVDDVRPRTQTKAAWSDERYREEVLREPPRPVAPVPVGLRRMV